MKKVSIHNLGCKVNSYEAESMEQLLVDAGYEMVAFDSDSIADIYIINTCSVTNIADRKSRQMLHKAKKKNPNAVVVAAGCYVNADVEKAIGDNAVDIVLGNNRKINIVEALEEYFKNHEKNMDVVDMNKSGEYEDLHIEKTTQHTRAYIKIQDGCNQFCSYCIIPYTRGRIRSRSIDDIYNEVCKVVQSGVKEIVLTGIHLSSYGLENHTGTLLDVIVRLSEIEGLKRIRLGSLEPNIITDEFVSVICKISKVCPHFHLSLQSGCDITLKHMNRKYTTNEYYEKCCILRKYYDNPAITTDVIVGFPNETDENFITTIEFLKKVNFYEMHIFKFSRRKGTAADKMSNQIDEKVKTIRSNELIDLGGRMSDNYRNYFVGKEKSVLIEEFVCLDNKQYAVGYTDNYIKVYILCNNQSDFNQSNFSLNNFNVNDLKVNDMVKVLLGPYDEKNGMMKARKVHALEAEQK